MFRTVGLFLFVVSLCSTHPGTGHSQSNGVPGDEATSAPLQVPSTESATGTDFTDDKQPCLHVQNCMKLDPPDPNTSHNWPVYTPANQHPWLTLVEFGAAIGLGTAWYWLDSERQVADWDYPGWKKKLLFSEDIFIFDNNPFWVNYTWHPFAGAAAQVAARANGMGIYSSMGLSLAATLFWEYGIEARELISINDILVTNTTGIALGEFFHQLGRYLHNQDDTRAWKTLRWTLGLPYSIHREYDDSEDPEMRVSGRFLFHAGVSSIDLTRQDGDQAEVSQEHTVQRVGFQGHLVALDDYMEMGERSGYFWQGNFTTLQLDFTRGDGNATHIFADTLLLGWRKQKIDDTGGYGLNVGTSIGYRYQRESFGAWQNKLGGLHIPGLAIDGQRFGDNWKFRWFFRGHVDLMGVNSLPNKQWREAYLVAENNEIGKSILDNSGYYYGWGKSANLTLEFELSRFTAGTSLFVGQYDSIEGFDRSRDELPYEITGNDDVFDAEMWIRGQFYRNAFFELRYEVHHREGALAEFKSEESMRRISLELGGSF